MRESFVHEILSAGGSGGGGVQRSAINERQLQRQFFLLSFFALHLFYRMVNHKCQHIKTENIKRGFEEGTADRKDYASLSPPFH